MKILYIVITVFHMSGNGGAHVTTSKIELDQDRCLAAKRALNYQRNEKHGMGYRVIKSQAWCI